MHKHPSDLKLDSRIVTAGRASEPGAPLNVPLVPAPSFIISQGHLPPSLLRLSVGIEDGDDLWADVDSAIRSAAA